MSRIPHVGHDTFPNTCPTPKFACPEIWTLSSTCRTRARNVSSFLDMCPVKKGIDEEEDRRKSYDSNANFDMEEQEDY